MWHEEECELVDQAAYNRSMDTLKKLHEAGITIEDLIELFSRRVCEVTDLRSKIKSFLLKMGARSNVRGFDYCAYALELGLKNSKALKNLKRRVYPVIAKEFDVQDYNVDKCIRTVIDTIFEDLNEEAATFFEDLDYSFGNPTVKMFLNYVADNFKPYETYE